MLRTLQSAFLRPFLNGLQFTTAATPSAVIDIGTDDFAGITRNGTGDATCTLRSDAYFARAPIVVGSPGVNVALGGFFDVTTAATYRYLNGKLCGTGGSGDDGTGYLMSLGFYSENTDICSPLQAVKNWARSPRLMAGRIAADGSITIGGRQFTVSLAATGIFTITPVVAFGRAPIVVASPVASAAKACQVYSTAASSIVVKTSRADGTAEANIFDLFILGWDSSDEQWGMGKAIQVPQRKPRIIAGVVSGTGTASITIGTGDFTLTDNGTGDYTVTWAKAFARAPLVITSAIGKRAQLLSAATTTEANIGTFNVGAPFAAADGVFSFIAMGYDTAEEF